MNEAERAAYVMAQVACAQIEAAGMVAENMQREACGHSMAYTAESFEDLPQKYGITHNQVIEFLRG